MSVYLPADLQEALELLAVDGRLVPMAGGTDLLVHWPQRHDERRRTYLDLSAIHALRAVRWEPDELVLGALATYWDVVQDAQAREELPLLGNAARQVGAIQIQARGTWAGNIANASPAADGVPVLMAYDATVVLESVEDRVAIPLADFYVGYKQLRREPHQLITAIRIPRRACDVQVFEKVGARRAQAITKVGLAVTHSAAGWRVVANSVAPTVRRCRAVERLLAEGAPVRSPDDLLPALREDVAPIDDIRSTARYRERVLARVLYYDLKDVCEAFQ